MSHLSKDQIESLSADLERLGRRETFRHLLLCTHCRTRAAALQLLDEEETWEEVPAAFSDKVLHRAVGILEERCSRACEEQAAAEPLRDEPSVGRLYLLRSEAGVEEVLDDLGTEKGGPCQEKRSKHPI
jgi:hypothetical protein